MPVTRQGIRYPVVADTPDIPRDISNLAADLDNLLGRGFTPFPVQEGAFPGIPTAPSTAYKVTAGAGMTIDVAAGVFLVRNDTASPALNDLVVAQKLTTANYAIAASNPSNPRIDLIQVNLDGSISVLTGTPTAGATLTNKSGAPSFGNDAERLAYVLVPAGSSSVTAPNIRDVRLWARGAFARLFRSAGDLALTSTTYASLGTEFQGRLAFRAGNHVEVHAHGQMSNASGGFGITIGPSWDTVTPGSELRIDCPGANIVTPINCFFWNTANTGFDTGFDIQYKLSSAFTMNVKASGNTLLWATIREHVLNSNVNG